LRGERTGIRYAIGTRLRVHVSRVDLDGRKIDFRLVRDAEDALLARAMKDKGVRDPDDAEPKGARKKGAAKKAAPRAAKPAPATRGAAKKATTKPKGGRKARR
jgi:ribonuclease R